MKFNKTTEFKKGLIGEKIVKSYLNNKDYVVYEVFQDKKNSKWEFFDIMAIKRDNRSNNPKTFIADVKTKPRMNLYNATGLDLRHFKKYIKMSESMNIPFKLFFVDEERKLLSFININRDMVLPENKIKSADGRTYPLVTDFNGSYDKMILFAVEQLTFVKRLTEKEVKDIKKYNTGAVYDLKQF